MLFKTKCYTNQVTRNIKVRSSKEDMAQQAQGLESLVKSLTGLDNDKKYPPVDKWDPPYCGEIGLKIAADGVWYYQGSPIGRKRLVRLFASVLRKDDDGRHYLVTPVEKIGIDVEDAPLLAVAMEVRGRDTEQILVFRTNMDDVVCAGEDNPIRFQLPGGSTDVNGPKPYILVRGRLQALVSRSVYYDLIELADFCKREEGDMFGVWSSGCFFPIGSADEVRQEA